MQIAGLPFASAASENGRACTLLASHPGGQPAIPNRLQTLYSSEAHGLIMATTFTWGINTLERETDDGFVFTAHYTVNANDGTYSSGAYGSIGFERPDNPIPYADLTEDLVIGWVKEALGGDEKVTEILDALQNQIDEQRAPTKANGVPW
jgi:hypothetical protein